MVRLDNCLLCWKTYFFLEKAGKAASSSRHESMRLEQGVCSAILGVERASSVVYSVVYGGNAVLLELCIGMYSIWIPFSSLMLSTEQTRVVRQGGR
jgi:hypothetical protein